MMPIFFAMVSTSCHAHPRPMVAASLRFAVVGDDAPHQRHIEAVLAAQLSQTLVARHPFRQPQLTQHVFGGNARLRFQLLQA